MGYSRPLDLTDSRPLAFAGEQSTASKLLGLELLRFASALAVLFFHYRHFAQLAGMPAVDRTSVPIFGLLWPLYEYGQFGVQIFWGISGYIFFWKYGAAIHAGAVSGVRFFWLRFSRLYPLHIVTLLAVIGLQAIHRQLAGFDYVYPAQDTGLFVRHLLLATDWGPPPSFSFNGPVWSISAEVAVYFGFFALICRLAPTMSLCIAIILAGLGLQMAGLDWPSIACATYFFAGGLAALAPPGSERKAGFTLLVLSLMFAASGILGDRGKLPMILLVTVPCLLVLLSRDWPVLNRWQRSVQFAGNLTYSSNLLHFPLQLLLAIGVAMSGLTPPLSSPWFLVAYLGITLTIAALSYRNFELPAQNWLRREVLRRVA
jgi:peptidoglycan/LPS O-acetylase OafA/YrhL